MAQANDTALRVMIDPDLKGLKPFKTGLVKVVAEATTTMTKNMATKIATAMKGQYKELEMSARKVVAIETALRTKNFSVERKARLQLQLDEHKVRTGLLEKNFKKELRQEGLIQKRRTKSLEKVMSSQAVTRKAGELGEKFGTEIQSAFEDLTSKDLSRMMKGPLTQLGTLTQKAGEGMVKKGKDGGAMGGVGKILAQLGPALIAIGSIAAGFAAIVAILLMVDSHAKELHHTILESGVAAGELTGKFGELDTQLGHVRETFTLASDFNRIWGTTAKDHLEVLGAYAEAGLTFREIRGNVKNVREEMEKLRDATQLTMVYSKLFGQGTQVMAGNIATWMEELGADFKTVQEGLSAIHIAARDSGFGIKRFYGMVLQATSGMSMYNVRLNETAGMLMTLGKILGASKAGEYIQGLTKGFTDESMTDRIVRVKTTGARKTQQIIGGSAEDISRDFMEKLINQSAAGGAEVAGLLKGIGVDLDPTNLAKMSKAHRAAAADELVDKLSKMSEDKLTDLLTDAALSGNEDLVRQLTNLQQVAGGVGGDEFAMAKALGGLDIGGKLAMTLAQGQSFIGKPLHEMGLKQLIAFEKMSGITGESLQQLIRIDRTMHGNWEKLDKQAKEGQQLSRDDMEDQIKAYGAAVKDGAVYSAHLAENGTIQWGEKLDNMADYIQGQGDIFAQAAKDGLAPDIQLAQDIARNTTEIAKVLEQGVEYWLEKIHHGVEDIVNWLGGGDDKAVRGAVSDKINKELEKNRDEQGELSKKISKWQSEIPTETAEGKDALRAKIGAAEMTLTRQRTKAAVLDKDLRTLSRQTSRGLFTPGRTEEEVRSQLHLGAPDATQTRAIPTSARKAGMKEALAAAAKASEVAQAAKPYPTTRDAADVAERRLDKRTQLAQYWTKRKMTAETGGGTFAKPDTSEGQTIDGTYYMPSQMEEAWEDVQKANTEDIISQMEADTAKQNQTLKDQTRVLEVADDKFFTKGYAKSRAAELATEIVKQGRADKRKEQVENITSYLRQTGMSKTSAEGGAEALVSGKGVGSQAGLKDRAALILRDLGDSESLSPAAALQLNEWLDKPKAEDFVMQVGRGGIKFAQRVDANDVGVFSKPGGALSQAGKGGGKGSNTFHLYGEGPGVLSMITRAQDAGLLS